MPKFIIERNIPGAGKLSREELAGITQASCSVLKGMGPQIQWLVRLLPTTRSTASTSPRMRRPSASTHAKASFPRTWCRLSAPSSIQRIPNTRTKQIRLVSNSPSPI